MGDHVKLGDPLYGDEKWRKLQQSSIYVLPSYSENFGITVAEALLSGLPVITSRATPWSELSSRGLGWIVDNDVTQLRDALDLAVSTDASRLRSHQRRSPGLRSAIHVAPDRGAVCGRIQMGFRAGHGQTGLDKLGKIDLRGVKAEPPNGNRRRNGHPLEVEAKRPNVTPAARRVQAGRLSAIYAPEQFLEWTDTDGGKF